MRPAPPGPPELGAHPTARGRRARPALAPGRRLQPREAFTVRLAAAERRTALPALPSPHAAVTRAGERSPEAELRPEDAGSPHRLPAASTPGQEPTRPEAEAVACASAPGDQGERGQGLFVYSTQTQFVTGWLCLGGGMLTWSNLRSQLGGTDVAGICRSNNSHSCACNSHRIFFPS